MSDASPGSVWTMIGAVAVALAGLAGAWVRGLFGDRRGRREANAVFQEQLMARVALLEAHDRERQEAFDALGREHAELSGRHAGLMFAKELLASEMMELRESAALMRERLARSEAREQALAAELRDLYAALDSWRPSDPPPGRPGRRGGSRG